MKTSEELIEELTLRVDALEAEIAELRRRVASSEASPDGPISQLVLKGEPLDLPEARERQVPVPTRKCDIKRYFWRHTPVVDTERSPKVTPEILESLGITLCAGGPSATFATHFDEAACDGAKQQSLEAKE